MQKVLTCIGKIQFKKFTEVPKSFKVEKLKSLKMLKKAGSIFACKKKESCQELSCLEYLSSVFNQLIFTIFCHYPKINFFYYFHRQHNTFVTLSHLIV